MKANEAKTVLYRAPNFSLPFVELLHVEYWISVCPVLQGIDLKQFSFDLSLELP